MSNAPATPPPSIDPLRAAWWVFALWVLVTYGLRFGALLYAEFGLDIETNIVDRDFANYWVGGKLTLDGNYLLLFDHDRYFAHLQSLFGPDYQIHSWSYPPHFLMLVAPLGTLDYRPALAAFLAVTFALFLWAALAFRRSYAPRISAGYLWLALFGYVMMMIEATQNGFLTGAMLLCVFAFMRERPVVAGFALALLTVKPQLGFLIPLLALLDRNWALLRWATVFTVALIGASIALFGVEAWRAYFTQVIPYQNFVMVEWQGIFLRMMPSTFGSLRTLGFTPDTAFMVQAVVSVLGFAVLLRLLFLLRDPLERVFALLAGIFLITPYSFNYDMGALSVMAALLALRARAANQHTATVAFGLLAVLPAATTKLGLMNLPISPLILAASLAALWMSARRPSS